MHPYKNRPHRHFWSCGVADGFQASEVGTFPRPLIEPGQKIVSAGSCFAANLVPYLEAHGFNYVRTEYLHSIFAQVPPEHMGYAKFSAGYGNIYTARQLLQLLLRATGLFTPDEWCWVVKDGYIDPFRPGLRYCARSKREFQLLTAQHLAATRSAFTSCDAFIFTLGLTEAWVSVKDGAVFPACPGTIAGAFDPQRYRFKNFSVEEVTADLKEFIGRLRQLNPKVRVILTVSPVPLVATAADNHVLAATLYSKSVLRVSAERSRIIDDTHYFPAYEIVTGPQAPSDYFEADCRNVSKRGIDTVMAAFLAACGVDAVADAPNPPAAAVDQPPVLSESIVQADCEEAGQER